MSDIPKEIIESFNSQINERLASPLTGSFTIAWLIWNYKFIVILVSANSVTKTFDLIHKICFPDFNAIVLNGFLYPLSSALIYVFILPYPASWAYTFTRNRQKKLAEIRQKIDDKTPLTIEESRSLRKELIEKDHFVDQTLSKNKEEITQLKSEVLSLREKLSMYERTVNKKFSPTLKHLAILAAISEAEFVVTRNKLVEELKFSGIEVDFMLDELVVNNCINNRQSDEDVVYGLAQNGRRYLIVPDNI